MFWDSIKYIHLELSYFFRVSKLTGTLCLQIQMK